MKLKNGDYLVKGRRVTGFSNKEEELAKLTDVMPFLLEDKLKANGGKFSKAEPWQKHVVVDSRIVTGQNPASAKAVAQEVINLLNL